MKYITSSSGNDGTSQVTVTFDVTRDVDLAAVDVQNRVNQALGRLPNEVKNTGVIITKQASGFILGAGAYAEGQYDSLFLSNYLDVYVKDAVKRVKGVGDVIVFGERKYAMRLWLDPAKMAQRGLTASNILGALQEQNVQVAAGQVGVPPLPPGQAYQVSVRAIGRDSIVKGIADVAFVTLGFASGVVYYDKDGVEQFSPSCASPRCRSCFLDSARWCRGRRMSPKSRPLWPHWADRCGRYAYRSTTGRWRSTPRQ